MYYTQSVPISIDERILVDERFQYLCSLVVFASVAQNARDEFKPFLVLFVFHLVEPFLSKINSVVVNIKRTDIEQEVFLVFSVLDSFKCFLYHFLRLLIVHLGYLQLGSEIEIVDVAFVVDGFALGFRLVDIVVGDGLPCLEDVRTDGSGI